MERSLQVRMMCEEDAASARAIEGEAHGRHWPATNFERELSSNPVARYVVLEDGARGIVGFAGLWIQLDEAHVVNVAVREDERGNGYGRLLVHALVDLAMRYGMSVATLECRESNVTARRLYGSYGFYDVGSRKGYYTDNGEAAVIMTTEELDSAPYVSRFAGLGINLGERFPGLRLTVDPETVADLRAG